jgi:hypothetical protein
MGAQAARVVGQSIGRIGVAVPGLWTGGGGYFAGRDALQVFPAQGRRWFACFPVDVTCMPAELFSLFGPGACACCYQLLEQGSRLFT